MSMDRRAKQLELCAEKEGCYIVQLKETVPFVDAGSPERSSKADAQHKLRQRRLGGPFNDRIHSLSGAPYRVPDDAGDLRKHGVRFPRNRLL